MSSMAAALAIALSVICALLIFVAYRLYRLERRIRAGAKASLGRGAATKGRDHSALIHLWAQFEGLVALYRVLDGKPILPPARRWAMSPDLLLTITNHILRNAPKNILECGAGTSTITFAYALQKLGHGGHIYSLENNSGIAEGLRQELKQRSLDQYVTVITAPLALKGYEALEGEFHWYEFDRELLPKEIDLLIVDGPYGKVNPNARYPAGPELFGNLSRDAHIFVDDAARMDEAKLPSLWRTLYPDLGVRELRAEKGALEMFFLDRKIEKFRPEELSARDGIE